MISANENLYFSYSAHKKFQLKSTEGNIKASEMCHVQIPIHHGQR